MFFRLRLSEIRDVWLFRVLKAVYRVLVSLFPVVLVPRLHFIRNRADWAQYINGKSVAIVGPAPMSRNFESAIESHDVIIRVGAEHWPWPATGERTDVWVLDGGGSREFLDTYFGNSKRGFPHRRMDSDSLLEVQHVINEIQTKKVPWVILKTGTRLSTSEFFGGFIWSRIGKSNAQVLWSRSPLFAGARGLGVKLSDVNLNQIPLALLELFLLQPRTVSVFGTDFYTRPGLAYARNSPSFESQLKGGENFIKKMLESHNQLEQKKVIEWVKSKRGWPEGDPLFLRLVEMEETQFLALYAPWSRT